MWKAMPANDENDLEMKTKQIVDQHARVFVYKFSSTFRATSFDLVASTAARDPPTTRAGGQDDGSYTNFFK